MKILGLCVLGLVILWLIIWGIGYLDKLFLSPKQIAEIATRGCPQSADLNKRFDDLYKAINKDLRVPHVFNAGDAIDWDKIYCNIDYITDYLRRDYERKSAIPKR